MKKSILVSLLLLLLLMCMAINAQSVLYLKNGSVIKGEVVEMNPNVDLKFKTADGSVFVWKFYEIDKIEEDGASAPNSILRTNNRRIEKKGTDFRWEDDGTTILESDLMEIFRPDIYNTYASARKQVNKGNAFLSVGVGCAAAAIVLAAYGGAESARNQNSPLSASDKSKTGEDAIAVAYLLCIPADAFICVGCVFRGIGNGRLTWVENEFNKSVRQNSLQKMLGSMSVNPSLMLSPQNDLALGATLSLRF